MNKKVMIMLIGILIIGGLYFVNKQNNKENNNFQNEQLDKSRDNSNNSLDDRNKDKVAIVYFSATGTTKTVAEYINNTTDGDLVEIVPTEKYTSSDLNYGNNNSRANKEQNNSSSRPKISNHIDVDNYNTIYLGYPIWWGDVPKIILTFLDTHDLSGKTVIPFCTSHSSGINESLNTLKNYNKNINWVDGKRFEGFNESEINDWIKSLS